MSDDDYLEGVELEGAELDDDADGIALKASAGRPFVTYGDPELDYLRALMTMPPVEVERVGGMQRWDGERWRAVDAEQCASMAHLRMLRGMRRLARAVHLGEWSFAADGRESRNAWWAEMRRAGMTVREIAATSGASKSTVQDALANCPEIEQRYDTLKIVVEPRPA
jgi:hypothetical protein